MTQIAVCGAKNCSNHLAKIAENVGTHIARSGSKLVCGGLGGVMKHAAKGAKNFGGTTIGILPSQDIGSANEFIDIIIASGVGFARNISVASSCHGMVVVGGHYGTLSEIAFALDLNKPVALIDSWTLKHKDALNVGQICISGKEAVEWIINEISRGHRELATNKSLNYGRCNSFIFNK